MGRKPTSNTTSNPDQMASGSPPNPNPTSNLNTNMTRTTRSSHKARAESTMAEDVAPPSQKNVEDVSENAGSSCSDPAQERVLGMAVTDVEATVPAKDVSGLVTGEGGVGEEDLEPGRPGLIKTSAWSVVRAAGGDNAATGSGGVQQVRFPGLEPSCSFGEAVAGSSRVRQAEFSGLQPIVSFGEAVAGSPRARQIEVPGWESSGPFEKGIAGPSRSSVLPINYSNPPSARPAKLPTPRSSGNPPLTKAAASSSAVGSFGLSPVGPVDPPEVQTIRQAGESPSAPIETTSNIESDSSHSRPRTISLHRTATQPSHGTTDQSATPDPPYNKENQNPFENPLRVVNLEALKEDVNPPVATEPVARNEPVVNQGRPQIIEESVQPSDPSAGSAGPAYPCDSHLIYSSKGSARSLIPNSSPNLNRVREVSHTRAGNGEAQAERVSTSSSPHGDRLDESGNDSDEISPLTKVPAINHHKRKGKEKARTFNEAFGNEEEQGSSGTQEKRRRRNPSEEREQTSVEGWLDRLRNADNLGFQELELPKYFEYPIQQIPLNREWSEVQRQEFLNDFWTFTPRSLVANIPATPALTSAVSDGYRCIKFVNTLLLMAPEGNGDKVPPTRRKLVLEYCLGDIFADAPAGTLILHSCNAKGVWGKGIALEFRTRCDVAYLNYRMVCTNSEPSELLGRALLIFPPNEKEARRSGIQPPPEHFIGCLFTREGYGKMQGRLVLEYVDDVLENTRDAMVSLLEGIRESIDRGELAADDIKEIRMPRINSGNFMVPWERTRDMLMDIDVLDDYPALTKIVVYYGVFDC